MKSRYRTMTCGDLRPTHEGQHVTLAGWVHRIRNLGAMLFIDLRDRYGITQVIFDERFASGDVCEQAKQLGHEFVIQIEGTVVVRESPNPKISTGLVEVQARSLTIFSESEVPPFAICDETIEAHEDIRLKYRYLDMRKGTIIPSLLMRHQAMQVIRHTLSEQNFVEVTTPLFGKSTPEGSRDYLVPSRLHPGKFYALLQSPQMFKQLLMIGGLDRYFQIAPCLRDEDLRADRQPEFYQIDMEMSFATQDELFPIIEHLVSRMFHECIGVDLAPPFRRISHRESMEKYGTDKPDLRFDMEFVDATELARESGFSIFTQAVDNGGIVKGITIRGGANLSRKEIEKYQQLTAQFGFPGIAWFKRQDEGIQGGIARHIENQSSAWIEQFDLQIGDIAMILAGPREGVLQTLDHLRRRLGRDFDLIDSKRYEPLWVVDFPLFAWNEDHTELTSETHPFTSPHFDDMEFLDSDPLRVRSMGYDLVLNGYEIGSGSVRIHDRAVQEKIFSLLALSDEEIKERFGFFVEALTYGTPPHLGIALGLDRLIMILLGTENIREVVAFPKNLHAQDLMTGAPDHVDASQLNDIHIQTKGANL